MLVRLKRIVKSQYDPVEKDLLTGEKLFTKERYKNLANISITAQKIYLGVILRMLYPKY